MVVDSSWLAQPRHAETPSETLLLCRRLEEVRATLGLAHPGSATHSHDAVIGSRTLPSDGGRSRNPNIGARRSCLPICEWLRTACEQLAGKLKGWPMISQFVHHSHIPDDRSDPWGRTAAKPQVIQKRAWRRLMRGFPEADFWPGMTSGLPLSQEEFAKVCWQRDG